MLKGKEKEDMLYTLVYQYIAEQYNNEIMHRETSSVYINAKGKLMGFCIAYEWQILESISLIQIRSKKGKLILEMSKMLNGKK